MECPTLWSKIMVLMGIDPVTYRRSNFFNIQTFTSWHFKTHFVILLSSAKNSHESCFEYTGLCNAWEYVLGFTRQTVSCSISELMKLCIISLSSMLSIMNCFSHLKDVITLNFPKGTRWILLQCRQSMKDIVLHSFYVKCLHNL